MTEKDPVAVRREMAGNYSTRDMQADRNYAAPEVTEKTKDALRQARPSHAEKRQRSDGEG